MSAAVAGPSRGRPVAATVAVLFLATSMVPSVALLVPTYVMLQQIGLLNSSVAIIVISAARLAPQTVWFMKNFIDAVPVDVDEVSYLMAFAIISCLPVVLVFLAAQHWFITGLTTASVKG